MIHQGDALDVLRTIPSASVQCCVTSPPYFGLRDYGTGSWDGGDPDCDHSQAPIGSAPSTKSTLTTQRREVATHCPCGARRVDRQIGLEQTPEEYVATLVEVFREVRRVLRADGTLWLNMGDSYNAGTAAPRKPSMTAEHGYWESEAITRRVTANDSKPKDLLGVPWMLAFALRADGWYLRSDIIWSKPNPMPESVTDRPTSAHEHVFLLAKSSRYYYDAEAIRESDSGLPAGNGFAGRQEHRLSGGLGVGGTEEHWQPGGGRNKRNVWEVVTQPYPEAHFATFPPRLVEPCVLAGTSPKACGVCGAPWQRVAHTEIDGSRAPARRNIIEPHVTQDGQGTNAKGSSTWGHWTRHVTDGWEPSCAHDDDTGRCLVLDPFAGSGTVGVVCAWYGRDFIGIELNPIYCEMARQRIMVEGRGGRVRPISQQIDGQMSLGV